VGIIPPPSANFGCVSFLAFSPQLAIVLGHTDSFTLKSSFTLSSTAPAINPITEPVTLKAGTFTTTIPPGSFAAVESDLKGLNRFLFNGVIDGTALNALIELTGTQRYALAARATGASLTGTKNPVPVGLIIGGNCGTSSVTAKITP
jgi:hypothetical protein